MEGTKALISLGDLSKPATVLVEKISDAIGGIFKPYQIRRVAQAEAEADKIKAVTQIEISELQRRALQRFMVEEAKKQQNIESITQKALPEVATDADPSKVEDDWITNFFDKCRLISDEEMQSLWARILSGEANSPGRFSKRTIDLVSSLDKVDANLFSKVCSFTFMIGGIYPLIYDVDDEIYRKQGLGFNTLSHLDSIGLIQFDPLAGFIRRNLGQKGYVGYFGKQVWIEFDKPEKNEMQVGHVLLTKAGEQLAPICNSTPCDGFVEYVQEKWKGFKYKTDPPGSEAPEQNT